MYKHNIAPHQTSANQDAVLIDKSPLVGNHRKSNLLTTYTVRPT